MIISSEHRIFWSVRRRCAKRGGRWSRSRSNNKSAVKIAGSVGRRMAMNKIASVRGVETPTVQELVARAGELAPLLRKNGPIGETNRRVVDESIEAVTKAGLMKVCTPRRYGGWAME